MSDEERNELTESHDDDENDVEAHSHWGREHHGGKDSDREHHGGKDSDREHHGGKDS